MNIIAELFLKYFNFFPHTMAEQNSDDKTSELINSENTFLVFSDEL